MKLAKRSIALIFAVLLVVLAPISARAHAELEGSSPADGSVLAAMPSTVTLTFGEKLIELGEEKVNTVSLTDPNGEAVALADVNVDGEKLLATVVSGANEGDFPSGGYEINYRVVSADGHPIKGSIHFELQAPEASASPLESSVATASTDDEAQSADGATGSTGINIGYIAIIVVIFLAIGSFFLIRRQK